jgi:chorismate-pyruvate lyase
MEEWVAAREAVSLDLASENQVKLLTRGGIRLGIALKRRRGRHRRRIKIEVL